jgi:hypothetical protein
MTKRKTWSEGRDIMRRQIDNAKRDIRKQIDRKSPGSGGRKEK